MQLFNTRTIGSACSRSLSAMTSSNSWTTTFVARPRTAGTNRTPFNALERIWLVTRSFCLTHNSTNKSKTGPTSERICSLCSTRLYLELPVTSSFRPSSTYLASRSTSTRTDSSVPLTRPTRTTLITLTFVPSF